MTPPVAIFVKNFENGGAEKQAALLARVLAPTHEVHFIVFNAKRTHQRNMDLVHTASGVRYVAFEGSTLARFIAFVRYLRCHRIALVFSYLTAANALACLAKLFCRVKVCIGLRNARLPWLKHVADALLARFFADAAIANSHSGAAHFARYGFPTRKLVVIPNCMESIATPVDRSPGNPPRIATVGRFVPQKDYPTILKSLAILKKREIPFAADLVGHGPLEDAVRRDVEHLELASSVTLHINPPNIPEILRTADIYLSASLFEGTSNSVMEAMNADLPVVATDVGDNSRLVLDGQNGFLVPPRDPAAIADKLQKLLDDPARRLEMGRLGKKFLAENFSPDPFLQAYLDLAARLLGP